MHVGFPMNDSAFASGLGGQAGSTPLLAGGRALVYRNKPGRVTSRHVQFVRRPPGSGESGPHS